MTMARSIVSAIFVMIALAANMAVAQGNPPQAIVLEVESVTEPQKPGDLRMAHILLHNIDGIDRVVIERFVSGNRTPSKFEVFDFKKGYFETDIDTDRSTMFTPVAYNAYGSTRGEPVTIEPASAGVTQPVAASGSFTAYPLPNGTIPVRLPALPDGNPDTRLLQPGLYIIAGNDNSKVLKIMVR